MARATAAPPATASEPPSQKSFCTSTIRSARTRPSVALAHIERRSRGDPHELAERSREHSVRVPGRSPHDVVGPQRGVDQGADRLRVTDWRYSADALPGARIDEVRIGPADLLDAEL